MPKTTDYCIGCYSFQPLTLCHLVPNHKPHKFCFKCKAAIKLIIVNAELQYGGWKEPMQMDRSRYLHIIKDFVLAK